MGNGEVGARGAHGGELRPDGGAQRAGWAIAARWGCAQEAAGRTGAGVPTAVVVRAVENRHGAATARVHGGPLHCVVRSWAQAVVPAVLRRGGKTLRVSQRPWRQCGQHEILKLPRFRGHFSNPRRSPICLPRSRHILRLFVNRWSSWCVSGKPAAFFPTAGDARKMLLINTA